VSEWLWFDKVLEGPFCVPTDGDLSTFDWAVEVRKTTNLDEWAQTLSDPPHGVYLPATVRLLRSAARLELDRIIGPAVVSTSRDNGQLDRIEGLIENNNALQMPVIELLEKLVDISSRPTAARAEESLRNYLSSQMVDALVPDARQSLIGAEYIFMDREMPDPPTVLRGIALAFEIQITEAVDAPLKREIEKLRAKVGVDYPNSTRPGQPIARKTHEENAGVLRRLERNLESPEGIVDAALLSLGLERTRILKAIEDVRLIRNEVTHNNRTWSYERVRKQRESWFGIRPGTSSIFSALVPLRVK
jgi:hypothetical protein